MKYMLLIYAEESALSERERVDCYGESLEVAHALQAEGKYLAASPLQLTSTAKSVRVRGGKAMVTTGPFAETREALGGYFLVEADSDEEAVQIASRLPGAQLGTVEVRPLVELGGMPENLSDAAFHDQLSTEKSFAR